MGIVESEAGMEGRDQQREGDLSGDEAMFTV
jgi:hypothetical protein